MKINRLFTNNGTEQSRPFEMWKQFTVQGNTKYSDVFPEILKQYSNAKHCSIKMTPTEASNKKNKGIAYFYLYGNVHVESSLYKPKFKAGDKVRISIREKYSTKVIHPIGQKKYL